MKNPALIVFPYLKNGINEPFLYSTKLKITPDHKVIISNPKTTLKASSDCLSCKIAPATDSRNYFRIEEGKLALMDLTGRIIFQIKSNCRAMLEPRIKLS